MLKTPGIICLALTLTVSACSSVSVQDYAGNTPTMAMEDFFDGDLVAHGILKDWRGRVTRRFSADIVAYWRDGVGTLEEDFVFDDGEIDRRVWRLQPRGPGRYDGTAGDVVGVGEVSVEGNAVFLDYVLDIPYGDDSINVRIDDRMYLITPDVLINESTLRKFGLKVGELVLVIARVEAGVPAAE